MGKMDEVIVVVPRRRVFADGEGALHGYLALESARAAAILRGLCDGPFGARRGDVEEDPSLLQPIPYVVVARATAGGGREVFAYTRLVGGGERRLHGRVSIGVGGHMNRAFTAETLPHVLREEAARELAEELCFHDAAGRPLDPPPARFIGLINDDSDPVSEVHFGLLAVAEVPAGVEVTVRETDQLEGRWTPVAQLRAAALRDRLETWSVHALEGITQG